MSETDTIRTRARAMINAAEARGENMTLAEAVTRVSIHASTADAARGMAEAITQAEKDKRIADTARKLAEYMAQVRRGAADGKDPATVAEIERLTQAFDESVNALVKSDDNVKASAQPDDPPAGYVRGRGGRLFKVEDTLQTFNLNSGQPVCFG